MAGQVAVATGALVPLPKAGLRLGLENVMERGDGDADEATYIPDP